MNIKDIRKVILYPLIEKMILGCNNLNEFNEIVNLYNNCDKFDKDIIKEEFKLLEVYKIEVDFSHDENYKYLKDYLQVFSYTKVAKLHNTSKQAINQNVLNRFDKLQIICKSKGLDIDIKKYLMDKYTLINTINIYNINKTQLVKELIEEAEEIEKKELLLRASKFIDIDNKTLTTLIGRLKNNKIIKIVNKIVYINK